MPLDNPDQLQNISDMDGALDARRIRLREDLASQVLHLTLGCPHDMGNPPCCPLHEVRKLTPMERVQWVLMLTDEELEYLANYHEICLHWRSFDDVPKKSVKKQPGRNPKPGSRALSGSVMAGFETSHDCSAGNAALRSP
jgi:hypothetical protein